MVLSALIYGRKSFDDPDRKTSSVADQIAAGRRYAEQNRFSVAGEYGDDGITGATMQRPALQRMLRALAEGAARIVIIEDVDRLSRDQEHLQHMAKRFRALGVALHTVAIGPVDNLVLSVKGIVAEEQRRRIAYSTRRGLIAKAARGGATGGRILGYIREIIGQGPNGIVDRLVIDPAEAVLVRRIFELYAAGHSLKQICAMLDADGFSPPRAKETGKYRPTCWNPSTLSGSIELAEGILNNEIYIGRRIFNRREWIEVPNDHRGFSRRPRLKPESEWQIQDEPELRIIDQGLWDRVKARQLAARFARDEKFKLTANPLSGAKRAKHLLSELVFCGACGSPFIATGAGRWRCKNHRGGACTNGSVTTAELEQRVLAGIRDRLLTPDLMRRFAGELQRDLEDAAAAQHSSRDRIEVDLVSTRTKIAKLVTRIEEDDDAPRALVARLKELEDAERQLSAELSTEPEPKIIRLPTNYEAVYARAVAELESHLSSEDGGTAREAIRALIEMVVVQPGDARGGKRRDMQLHGDLFRMLEFASRAGKPTARPPNAKLPRTVGSEGVVIPLVAGTGFEPVTFRL